MEVFVAIIAVIAGLAGIIGSVLPALPGPPLSWVGVLLMYFWGGTNADGEPMSLAVLLVTLGITVAVTILDYIVPAYFTKISGGSKYASWGATIGLLLGIFIAPPLGMIICSIIGAWVLEMIYAKKSSAEAFKSAMGAFWGFLIGTGLKLIVCGVMMYYIIVYI